MNSLNYASSHSKSWKKAWVPPLFFLGLELRSLYMLGKCSATELYPQPMNNFDREVNWVRIHNERSIELFPVCVTNLPVRLSVGNLWVWPWNIIVSLKKKIKLQACSQEAYGTQSPAGGWWVFPKCRSHIHFMYLEDWSLLPYSVLISTIRLNNSLEA